MAAANGPAAAQPPAGPPSEYEPYLSVALAAAKEAGAVIAAAWDAHKTIDTKSGEAPPSCCRLHAPQAPSHGLQLPSSTCPPHATAADSSPCCTTPTG